MLTGMNDGVLGECALDPVALLPSIRVFVRWAWWTSGSAMDCFNKLSLASADCKEPHKAGGHGYGDCIIVVYNEASDHTGVVVTTLIPFAQKYM